MKKRSLVFIVLILTTIFFSACKPKVKQVPPTPPPQVKEQPKVEKVEPPKETAKRPLTEEEIFMSQSLEEANKAGYLKMIHFDFDKYNIRDDMKPILAQNAAWLKKFQSVKILIEGHCDERGTEEYNLALGERRAKSTFDYLVSLGISPDRMKIISYGKSQPLDPGHNEEAWAKNRRAQFTIIEK
ncbi:MAG: peptidoglycan-associated lipoprotein Pal [Candidatus Aminicenantes bacterium]|nr:peptidoglycan-associated lipoprotein Pal [Candidatus Aminicenantes bacterium]